MFRQATRVVALWPGAAAAIERLYRVRPERIVVIPNARSRRELCPAEPAAKRAAREAWGVPAGAVVVASVGALSEEKRVDVAIRAIAQLPGAWLLVAGDGPLREPLRQLAEACAPGRVLFLGTVADVQVVLHAADALVLMSRTEGSPGVVIEAALCALPVVASHVGALAELVDDGTTGRLVSDVRPEVVAAALRDVVEDAPRLGAAARSRAEARFTWTTVTPAWSDLVQSVAP